MKKLTSYLIRATFSLAFAFVFAILNIGITSPINIFTLSFSILLGAPGVALSLILCNVIF